MYMYQKIKNIFKHHYEFTFFIYVDDKGQLYKNGIGDKIKWLDTLTIYNTKKEALFEAWKEIKSKNPDYINYIFLLNQTKI